MTHSPAKPAPEALAQVEKRLYNRMVKNAFFGFIKSAVVGAALGFAVGAVVAMFTGGGLMAAAVAGGLKAAAWFGGVSGSFGAVAAIQSTRDTRRFFLLHEGSREVKNVIEEDLGQHHDLPSPEVAHPTHSHHTNKIRERMESEQAAGHSL